MGDVTPVMGPELARARAELKGAWYEHEREASEVDRLRAAINKHRDAVMAETEYVTALKADAELWAALDAS